MSSVLRSLKLVIGADFSKAQKGLQQASKEFKKTGREITEAGKTLTLGVTLPIMGAAVASVKLASDLSETMNKVDMVFGESADAVKSWSETSIKQMGLAKQTALDMAALYGDMGTSMGFTADEAAKMGEQLTERAADLASFKNISIEVAKTALNGVFSGETESLKQLGVVMTLTNLDAFALEKGMGKTYKQMSQNEQVQLRLAYVMEKTSNAAGDFARTSDGVANQTRAAVEQVKELGASLGEVLLPAAAKALKSINNLTQGFIDLPDEQKRTIVTFGLVLAAVGPVVTIVGKLNTGIGNVMTSMANFSKAMASGSGLIASLGALIGPAGIAVLAIAAIAGIGMAMYAATSDTREATREINHFSKAINDSATAYETQLQGIKTESTAISSLSDDLFALSRKENKSNVEKLQMKSLVTQLNKLLPEMNLSIDEQTGALNMNEQAMKRYLETREQQIAMQAAEERMLAIKKEEAEANELIAKTQTRLNEVNDEHKAFVEAWKDPSKSWKGRYAWQITDEIAALEKALAKAQGDQSAIAARASAVADTWKTLADSVVKSNEEMAGSQQKTTELTEEELAERAALIQEFADKAKEVEQKRLEDAAEYQKSFQDAAKTHLQEMYNIEHNGIEQSKLTAQEVQKNLEKQYEDYRTWQAGIQKLAKRVPDDVMAALTDLGPGYQVIIDDLIKMTDEELVEWVATWQLAAGDANLAARDELKGLPGAFRETGIDCGNLFAEGMKSQEQRIRESAAALSKAATITPPSVHVPGASGRPSYAVGTTYVPHDMTADIHQGEAIIPANQNPFTKGFSGETNQLLKQLISLVQNQGDAKVIIDGREVGKATLPWTLKEAARANKAWPVKA